MKPTPFSSGYRNHQRTMTGARLTCDDGLHRVTRLSFVVPNVRNDGAQQLVGASEDRQ